MGYPHSLPGNEDRRSGAQERPQPEPIRPTTLRRGPDPAILVALAVLAVIAVLVVKPWTLVGPRDPSAGSITGAGQPTSASPSPASSTTAVPSPDTPDVIGVGPGPTASQSFPPDAYLENTVPIEPDRWTHLSATLRGINRDAVVFVARVGDSGLYWGFLPIDPSESLLMGFVQEAPTYGPDGSPAGGVGNAVRKTGYLAAPVAIGITRPAGASAPLTVAWLILGPGTEERVTLRNPVGDLDRYLWLGPGLGLPRGEQRNRREISRWPPTWPPGLYRFDLTTAEGTRHLFIDLEP